MKSIVTRHNVTVRGQGERAIVFSHGFGCDQHMWHKIAPAFEADFKVVLFDTIGAGASDITTYNAQEYISLERYADDVLAICDALELRDAVFVGHSVSSMVGMLAAIRKPAYFSHLIMIAPSPCYINDGDYIGGFERDDLDDILAFLDDNYVAWSKSLAPVIIGPGAGPVLGGELEASFCRSDATIARQFARLTFLSDSRDALANVQVPSLILQCTQDSIVPEAVGHFLAARLRDSTLVQLAATGHCPHLSAPDETLAAIRTYLA